MSYASQADLTERFGATELAQRTNRTDGLTIDTVVLGRALADADAEIDGYLVTVFKKGDLWNYCVAEILDEEESASGEKPDVEFGDEYPTKAEAKREALIYIGVF